MHWQTFSQCQSESQLPSHESIIKHRRLSVLPSQRSLSSGLPKAGKVLIHLAAGFSAGSSGNLACPLLPEGP